MEKCVDIQYSTLVAKFGLCNQRKGTTVEDWSTLGYKMALCGKDGGR